MINQPPIDELTKLAGNKYALCCAVSKRPHQEQGIPGSKLQSVF